MATIEEFLAQTKLPEAALKPITEKLSEYTALVSNSNELVASINAAKAQDPNNVEYLDTRWKAKAEENDPKVSELAEKFYAVAEQYEKFLKELREIAKANFIPQALSEDAAKDAKKKVNEMSPVISEAKKGLSAQLAIPESMLQLMNVQLPEGGLASLLPQAESLKNIRGRKATTASGEGKAYKTRVGDVLINGESTQINGKGRLDYAADKLSEMWNAANVPQNKVTGEEIEEAWFKAMDKPFRSLKSTEVPDETEFVFEKTIQVKNSNDDSFTEVPQKVRLKVISTEANKPAETSDEKAQPEKVEAPAEKVEPKPESKQQPMKIDTRTENQKAADEKAKTQPKK